MEVKIQAVHFDATEKLEAFVTKKIDRFARRHKTATDALVTFKLVKPETAMNKDATIQVSVPQHGELVASKTADTFEEAFDVALEAIDRQLERIKQRKQSVTI